MREWNQLIFSDLTFYQISRLLARYYCSLILTTLVVELLLLLLHDAFEVHDMIIHQTASPKFLKTTIHTGCVRLLVRTGTKSIPLLVGRESGRSIVGLGRNRLFRTRPFLTWLAVELSKSGSTKWYWNDSNCLFIADRSVPINEHTHNKILLLTLSMCHCISPKWIHYI
jgi:hypothetical protein